MKRNPKMAKRKVAFRSKRQNRFGMFLVSAAVIMLLIVISINCYSLKQKHNDYLAIEAELDAQIAQEENRAAELEEFKKYSQTEAYIEEIAKERLGLVREGEIVFKME